jgi:hypothetical protein
MTHRISARMPVTAARVREILADKSVRPVARFVYAELCDLAPRRGQWFPEAEICALVRCRRGTLHQWLTELAAAGILLRSRDPRRRHFVYELPRVARRDRRWIGSYAAHFFAVTKADLDARRPSERNGASSVVDDLRPGA